MDKTIEELVEMFRPTITKRTKDCKGWMKFATKYREEHGVDKFNNLLDEIQKRIG